MAIPVQLPLALEAQPMRKKPVLHFGEISLAELIDSSISLEKQGSVARQPNMMQAFINASLRFLFP